MSREIHLLDKYVSELPVGQPESNIAQKHPSLFIDRSKKQGFEQPHSSTQDPYQQNIKSKKIKTLKLPQPDTTGGRLLLYHPVESVPFAFETVLMPA